MTISRPFAALALVALLSLTQSVATAKPAGSITGAWRVTLGQAEESHSDTFTMWLKLDGSAVAGTVQFEKEKAAIFDGMWRDGSLVVVVGSSKKKTWYLTLRGTLHADGTLAGTVEEYDNGKRLTGTFEARR